MMQVPGLPCRGVSPDRMRQLFMMGRMMGRQAGLHSSPAPVKKSAAAASPAAPAGAPAADLVSWVESSGGTIVGVHVQRDAAGGLGLAAAADVGAGSTLIALPQRCHLSYDDASDPRLLALIEQVPAELWGAKLALAVVGQRLLGGGSPWAAYVANLPLGVQGLPMFFGGDALGALQYPPVTEQVKRRCRWLLAFTQQALAPVRGTPEDPFAGAEVDANALGWALAVVTSRAFRTRGPGQPAAMLPFIDMANHSFEPNARITPGPGGAMHMVAARALSAGEPVLLSYGNLQNDFLLMDYGFVIPGNPFETVQLRFGPELVEAAKAVAGMGSASGGALADAEELPPLPAWQAQALAALQLAGPGANTEVSIRRAAAGNSSSGPVDPRLLAGVRVLCAPNAAALAARSGVEALGRWDVPVVPPPAELAALRTLTGLCAIALSQFQGTLEDDRRLLQQGAGQQQQGGSEAPAASGGDAEQQPQQPLSADMRLAVTFRADKKQLLLDALAAITARIAEVTAAAEAGSGGGGSKGRPPKAKTGGKGFA